MIIVGKRSENFKMHSVQNVLQDGDLNVFYFPKCIDIYIKDIPIAFYIYIAYYISN